MMRSANESMKVPSGALITGHILPFINKEAKELVRNSFLSATAVVVSFDLRMSSWVKDIFSVSAYVCDFREGLKSSHLALVRMGHKNATSLATQLENILKANDVTKRCVGYVSDGGSNLSAC